MQTLRINRWYEGLSVDNEQEGGFSHAQGIDYRRKPGYILAGNDLESNFSITQLVDPVTVTSDTDSASIDLKGYASAGIIFNVGESGDTLSGSVYWSLELEESDDDSTWTDVAAADMGTSVSAGTVAVIDAAAEDDSVHFTSYKGNKRYIRGVLNATGTHTNGTPISVTGVRYNEKYPPV